MSVPEALANHCRLCMSSTGAMKDIFSDVESSRSSFPMKISLIACIEVQPSDQLPKQLCEACVYQLEKFYIFRKLCKKSEVKYKAFLRKVRNKKAKSLEELSDDEDDGEEWDDTNAAYVESFEKKIIDMEVKKQCQSQTDQSKELKVQLEEDYKQKLALQKKRLLRDMRSEILEAISNIETAEDFEDEEASSEETPAETPVDPMIEPMIAPFNHDEEIVQYDVVKAARRGRSVVVKNGLIHNCPICARKFHTLDEKQRHIENHQTSTHECNTCGKVFATTGGLTRHRMIHSGEKIFKCKDCDKGFNQKGSLLRHSLVHSEMKPFTCGKCDRAYTQRHLLTKHIAMEHSETPVTFLYPCKVCPKSFNYSSGLSRHMVIHTGRKYPCDHCPRQFNDNSSRSRHIRVKHSGGERLQNTL